MAKKKVINTSKTAHVMNLISKNYKETDDTEDTAAPADPQEGAAGTSSGAAPAPVTPQAIVPSLPSDLEITSQIKDALEDLVEEEPVLPQEEIEEKDHTSEPLPEPETEPEKTLPAPAPVSAASKESAVLTDAEPEPAPQSEPEASAVPAAQQPVVQDPVVSIPAPEASAADPTAQAPAAQPEIPAEPAPPVPADPLPASAAQSSPAVPAPETSYLNIMQALVEDSADRYIKMFGLCDCPKCVADVKALALNNLVPKYIVAPENERNPRVIIYNERYHAEVTAQILRACKIVMDNPLHEQ